MKTNCQRRIWRMSAKSFTFDMERVGMSFLKCSIQFVVTKLAFSRSKHFKDNNFKVLVGLITIAITIAMYITIALKGTQGAMLYIHRALRFRMMFQT